jgi:hypothetical protein
MGNLRFLGLAVALLFAAYFGTQQLLVVRPLKPDARIPTFQRVDTNSERYKLEQSYASDDDPTRDRLRNDVLDYAKAYGDDPCNDVLKAAYVKVVTAYVRAWSSIVPCLRSNTCRSSDWPALERAGQAFGSPLDRRVREAMQRVHAKAAFAPGDFPDDIAALVAQLTNDNSINFKPDPHFQQVASQPGVNSAKQDCGH